MINKFWSNITDQYEVLLISVCGKIFRIIPVSLTHQRCVSAPVCAKTSSVRHSVGPEPDGTQRHGSEPGLYGTPQDRQQDQLLPAGLTDRPTHINSASNQKKCLTSDPVSGLTRSGLGSFLWSLICPALVLSLFPGLWCDALWSAVCGLSRSLQDQVPVNKPAPSEEKLRSAPKDVKLHRTLTAVLPGISFKTKASRGNLSLLPVSDRSCWWEFAPVIWDSH